MTVEAFRREFIELALACEALRFGRFTLKSGRSSPYFFDCGAFSTGAAMRRLAACYAGCIAAAGLRFDALFGPAYKGIALVSAVAMAWHEHSGYDLPYSYDRKEAKRHGEGGQLVGGLAHGARVLVVDDVLTAGTALTHAVALLRHHGAVPVGLVVALDRQERDADGHRCADTLAARHRLEVLSVASLSDLLAYTAERPGQDDPLATLRACVQPSPPTGNGAE